MNWIRRYKQTQAHIAACTGKKPCRQPYRPYPTGSTLCAWPAFITKGGGGQVFSGCAQLPHLSKVYLERSGRPALIARFGSCQVFSGCAQLATQGFHALSQRPQLQLHHLHALRPHLGRHPLPAALTGAPAQQDAHLLAPKQSAPRPAPLLSTRNFLV